MGAQGRCIVKGWIMVGDTHVLASEIVRVKETRYGTLLTFRDGRQMESRTPCHAVMEDIRAAQDRAS